jgi:NADH:ubiquinone oxidoreductase subunit F (NADH-binding)/Pyruvate/2-oxoacid:ferredoxin oxidoreductase delta subunit
MDRSILEGDPHRLIEAMALTGYAIGADQGYVYVRAEYPIAIERLRWAINQAQEKGLLGDNILGSGFSFNLDIRLGAGAFVCGEETALLNSIEGRRGEPRLRPPFPAVSGLWGSPTIINNVETYANVPSIILNGADWFSSIGTEKSKGTKVFTLAGNINNIGLIEIPMGTTLRTVIEDIGGGIPNGKKYKAAQTGGPSGGCIPTDNLDIEIDYDNLQAIGSMMGSGGLIVMDEDNCMVDIARFYLEFTQDESCGKCTTCRIGTKRMLETLEKITEGKGEDGDIDKLETLASTIKNASICGLGQTAPNPVLSTLMYFRDEYEAHIIEKKCPAQSCQNLLSYSIIDEKCTGCSLCARVCPTSAITGKVKEPYKIDPDACIGCGECMKKCKVEAIVRK